MTLVLGLDLSINKCGYCIMEIRDKTIIKSGVIEISKEAPLTHRIQYLIRELKSIVNKGQTEIEGVFVERLNPTLSKQTSFTFGVLMGMAGTLFRDKIVEFKPIEWRKIIYRNYREGDIKGIGREKQKELAIKEFENRYQRSPIDDNEAEATLIAIAGSIWH